MDKAQVMTDKLITYLIENGPKLAGAIGILFVGFLVARAVGNLIERWLSKKDLEPPVKMLISRIVRLRWSSRLARAALTSRPWWRASEWRVSGSDWRCKAFWAISSQDY